MIQRGIDDAVLARVFGVFEILAVSASGGGSGIGSVLVEQLGVRTAIARASASASSRPYRDTR